MDKQKHAQPHEEVVDSFIEDLLREEKPRVYRESAGGENENDDGELEKLFETVRAVKRLRREKWKGHIWQRRWFRGVAAVAAAVLIVMGIGVLRPGIMPEAGMVEAVVKAYEELESYRGVVEIRGERDDTVEFLETVHVSYKKPFKYAAVHSYDGYERGYQSDGRRLAVIDSNSVKMDNLFPEKELWRFHIGTTVYELEAASEVTVLETEMLFGREVTVLEYRYSGDAEAHFLWIDRATNLPLRKILNHPEGTRLVVEFQELEINPVLGDSIFELELPPEIPVHDLNLSLPAEQVLAKWPRATSGPVELLQQQGLEMWQAGELEEYHLYEYVLRFQGEKETDFLDIFFTAEPQELFYLGNSRMGRLGGGIVEINAAVRNIFEVYIGDSRMARWIRDEGDIFIVSSRGTGELASLLEKMAGENITFVEASELKKEGLEPAYEKEGH